jgi:hypothetical protein
MIDDNDKKVKYLADLLEKYLALRDIKVDVGRRRR